MALTNVVALGVNTKSISGTDDGAESRTSPVSGSPDGFSHSETTDGVSTDIYIRCSRSDDLHHSYVSL